MYRIGTASDTHKLVANRKLILGGIEIPYDKGLLGHSDGDALLHCIASAILGALSLDDLGHYFSDKDIKYKDIDSKIILEEVYKIMDSKGYKINNIDTTIHIESPMMAPYINKMKEVIAKILNSSVENIGIKATRGETLGFVGAGLGVVCECSCLLIKK